MEERICESSVKLKKSLPYLHVFLSDFLAISRVLLFHDFHASRDLFVDEDMKPLNRVVSESNLEYIFNMDDESMLVSRNFVFKSSIIGDNPPSPQPVYTLY